MSNRTVLLPLDGSSWALAAVESLHTLFDPRDTRVILVHVAAVPEGYGARFTPPSQCAGGGEIQAMLPPSRTAVAPSIYQSQAWESVRAEVDEAFTEELQGLRAAGYQASLTVCFGDPAQELAALSSALGVSAVMMATHGRSGVSKALLGSVAERLLRLVTVPVIMVRAAAAG